MKRTPPRGLTTLPVDMEFNFLAGYLVGKAQLIKCSPIKYRYGLRVIINKLWEEIDRNMSTNPEKS